MPKLFGNKLPRKFLFIIGTYTIGKTIYNRTYSTISQNFVHSQINFADRYGDGSWVVISGATNDTGKEFSKRFAKQGFRLILLDTDQEQLNSLKKDLEVPGDEAKI